jgi:hypothetical protein
LQFGLQTGEQPMSGFAGEAATIDPLADVRF